MTWLRDRADDLVRALRWLLFVVPAGFALWWAIRRDDRETARREAALREFRAREAEAQRVRDADVALARQRHDAAVARAADERAADEKKSAATLVNEEERR